MQLKTASFSGHESFPFRNTWLTKGVLACSRDPTIFTKDEAMVVLGVGKNMVQSIRHWCLATRVLEEDPQAKNNRGRRLRPTVLGEKVFLGQGGWDPYLEDVGTMWLIHWSLVTNPERATTWRLAFSFLHQPEFTRHGLERAVAGLAARLPNVRATRETIRRDVEVFIRTYVGASASFHLPLEDSLDCPLVELGLITELEAHDLYAFARGPKDSLPDAVLLFALWEYTRRYPQRRTFNFGELAYGAFSPGQAFKLDEASLADRLDRLPELTDGAWQFSETAGRAQLLVGTDLDGLAILGEYYRRGVR